MSNDSKQESSASEIVDALAEAADGDGVSELVAQAKDNFEPTAEEQMGDIFYALGVPDGIYTSSCWSRLDEDFQEFWQNTCDYIMVELDWWCGDHGHPLKDVFEAIKPGLWQLNQDDVLEPIGGPDDYERVRILPDRKGRRFFFADARIEPEERARLLKDLVAQTEQSPD